jgi:integrase
LDVDLDGARVTIVRTLVTTEARGKGSTGMAWGTPKTAKGRRQIALDVDTVTALRAHKARQAAEKLALGAGYDDGDLVVCMPDGRPVHPKTMSWYFERDIAAFDLPRIRLHDLRHTHATLALKAGVHPRIVQERLGHANVSITLDTYSHVDLDMQAAAAAQVSALLNGLGQP